MLEKKLVFGHFGHKVPYQDLVRYYRVARFFESVWRCSPLDLCMMMIGSRLEAH